MYCNHKYFASPSNTGTLSSAKIIDALLIDPFHSFASFVQGLIGESAKCQQLELDFTATRRVSRREISVLTLARRIIDAAPHYLRLLSPWNAIPPLAEQARCACAEFT